MSASRLLNRNVKAASGERTSIRLEPELWDALRQIAAAAGLTLPAMVQRIEAEAPPGSGRTSAVRVFIVEHYRKLAGGRL
jgi:predicted DNA-binding ribbon-helix-helix protein